MNASRSHAAGQVKLGWFASHHRDVRFLSIFALTILAFYLLSLTSVAEDRVFPWYLRWNAAVSGWILQQLGQPISVNEFAISIPGFAIEIRRGCDAVEPSALFVAAVMASPVPWTARLLASLVGTVALMALNLVRIVSLFLIGVHYRRIFSVMHLDVWQAIFIFLAILLWALWASRAAKKYAIRTPAPA